MELCFCQKISFTNGHPKSLKWNFFRFLPPFSLKWASNRDSGLVRSQVSRARTFTLGPSWVAPGVGSVGNMDYLLWGWLCSGYMDLPDTLLPLEFLKSRFSVAFQPEPHLHQLVALPWYLRIEDRGFFTVPFAVAQVSVPISGPKRLISSPYHVCSVAQPLTGSAHCPVVLAWMLIAHRGTPLRGRDLAFDQDCRAAWE